MTQKRRNGSAFGLHLTLDGYGGDPEALAHKTRIREFLEQLPEEIGMTRIMGPYVSRYDPPPGKPPEDWGVSGVVIIAESHISLHTFPQKRYLSFDLFSCRDFDIARVTDRVIEEFNLKRIEPHIINRGLEFPRDKDAVAALMERDRQSLCGGGG